MAVNITELEEKAKEFENELRSKVEGNSLAVDREAVKNRVKEISSEGK